MFQSLEQLFTHSPVDPASLAQSLWFIIALPLLGAAVCGVLGRSLGRGNVQLIACASVGASFLLSLVVFWAINDRATALPAAHGYESIGYAIGYDYGNWFSAGSFTVRFGLFVDHLSGTLLLVITGVGFLIHMYSTSYMEHDAGYWRYFAYLNLFVAMMLTLVMADNMVLTFVGWEGVGLCSYLLIGFWYTDAAKAWAGRKAFVTNRIGDFAFVIGMILLALMVWAFTTHAPGDNFQDHRGDRFRAAMAAKGPLNYQGLEAMSRSLSLPSQVGRLNPGSEIESGPLAGRTYGEVITAVLLLFLLGAAGKSAQLPLYVWLPDAMAGPTPVSALIHAATMVTAGVYLFCRVSYLLTFSPFAMAAVALVGAATALWAALIAFAQDDIKKVLAYSTVSQLGFMFMGVGMGVFWAAVFHLVTHAFFKACLFLGAGSVMHGNADETDIKKLGGLRKEMPWTWFTFLIATFAITGIVPLSGFLSKDAILHGVHETVLKPYPWVSGVVYGVGLLTAGCTAFYMMRLYFLTFEGARSADAKVPHAHESAWPMTSALTLLAGLSVVALAYGLPLIQMNGERQVVLENFLGPVFYTARRITQSSGNFEAHEGGSIWVAYGTAWAIALAGGGIALFLYRRYFPSVVGKPVPAAMRALRRVAQNKFYVDELYDAVIIKPIKFGSFVLYRVVDGLLIDTIAVRGTAWVTTRAGSLLRYFQTGDAQSYAAVMALALLGCVAYAFFMLK